LRIKKGTRRKQLTVAPILGLFGSREAKGDIMSDDQQVSTRQAYRAMLIFLERTYDLTRSDDLAGLLGGWQLKVDGETMDPAAWGDWLAAVHSVMNSE
jgi:hypothetical protein